jgi:hypothetical protein
MKRGLQVSGEMSGNTSHHSFLPSKAAVIQFTYFGILQLPTSMLYLQNNSTDFDKTVLEIDSETVSGKCNTGSV